VQLPSAICKFRLRAYMQRDCKTRVQCISLSTYCVQCAMRVVAVLALYSVLCPLLAHACGCYCTRWYIKSTIVCVELMWLQCFACTLSEITSIHTGSGVASCHIPMLEVDNPMGTKVGILSGSGCIPHLCCFVASMLVWQPHNADSRARADSRLSANCGVQFSVHVAWQPRTASGHVCDNVMVVSTNFHVACFAIPLPGQFTYT
jgi:hypothetical protein